MNMLHKMISITMAVVILLGIVPLPAYAAQNGTNHTDYPDHPGYLASSYRDAGYLELSFEKYGKTIKATDDSVPTVPVLEYTQWQINARFIRYVDGVVTEDRDVTSVCTWTTSDSTGEILTVTPDGLVTAWKASSAIPSVMAAYEGYETVEGEFGTELVPTTFKQNIYFEVSGITIPAEDKESLCCLAMDYLASYEWDAMASHEGKTVAEWVDAIQRRRFQNRPTISAPNNHLTESYLISYADSNPQYNNSARVLHFLSAAAGECTIVRALRGGDGIVQAVIFQDGLQTYIAYALPNPERSILLADTFATGEANGTRRFETLANANYAVHKPYFDAGINLYRAYVGQKNNVKVTGQYYGGVIAKYVSYVSGCEALTFNASSPFQYVYLNNFEELCRYFSVSRQLSYNFREIYASSSMYDIEPGYVINRYYGNSIDAVNYITNTETVALGKTRIGEDIPLHNIWNRRMYLGRDGTDVYQDDYYDVKIMKTCLFGGDGADQLTSAFAMWDLVDGWTKALDACEWLKDYVGCDSVKPLSERVLKTLRGAAAGLVVDLHTSSIVDSNMVTGGPGADRLRGSVWDTVFCYTKGDGPDHYTVYGSWNSFLLMGYGNSKVTIEETYSEDLETVSVLINGTDRIEIDISHLDHGYISFYQHDPVTKEPIPVHTLTPKKAPVDVNYWRYSCPVTVQVLNASGQVVQELADGAEYLDVTDYGIFVTAKENGEYSKSVMLFDSSYTVRALGVGLGKMEVCRYFWDYEQEDGIYYNIGDIRVTTGAVYQTGNNPEDALLYVDVNADGKVDSTVTFDTAISFPEENLSLSLGDGQQLLPSITTSSLETDCYWVSSDNSVVQVDAQGYVVAMTPGNATVYAVVNDGSGAYAKCDITVTADRNSVDDFTITGLEEIYKYTGQQVELALEVSLGVIPLVQGVDYDIEVQELTQPGDWTITITGLNRFTGSQELHFSIIESEAPKTLTEKVAWIADQCRAEGITDEWEIALWLHDWLIHNAEYDLNYQYYHPDGVLLEGRGVCQSYSEGYSMLLNVFGIENIVLVSTEMDHAWNLVNLNGEWCHVDCTWDDPIPNGAEYHHYFGMNDSMISLDHSWVTSNYPAATSKENYYYAHRCPNVIRSRDEIDQTFSRLAEDEAFYYQCIYLGDEELNLFEEFVRWWKENDWKYGLDEYWLTSEGFIMNVEIKYTEPWEEPSGPAEQYQCPDFTLYGPGGTYPLRNYDNTGVILIFGSAIFEDTIPLLNELHPYTDQLKQMGIPVLVNEYIQEDPLPDLSYLMHRYPGFDFTYWDAPLQAKLMLMTEGDYWYDKEHQYAYVIDKDGNIVYSAAGMAVNCKSLIEAAQAVSTGASIPPPEPVDPRYHGCGYSHTGDIADLAAELETHITRRRNFFTVHDGTWTGEIWDWESDELEELLIRLCQEYAIRTRDDITYTVGQSPMFQHVQVKYVTVTFTYPEDEGASHTHSGGQATCIAAPICTFCGESYGFIDPNTHAGKWEIHNAVEAQEFQDGYTGDVVCMDCYSVIDYGMVIPATHTHSYGGWKSDASDHWHECSCGSVTDKAAHVPGPEATEAAPQICTVCGYELAPALGTAHTHELTKVEAQKPTHDHGGNTEYYVCECGKWFADEDGTAEIADQDSVIISVLPITYGDVNHDGRINVSDAVAVMKHRAGALSEKDTFCDHCANVDTNPKINVSDAVLIMKKRANKDMVFPIQMQP